MSEESKNGWFKPWISVQNALLFLAMCFVIALFDFNKSELASWVQAVGSIAAIWGAFWISNYQVIKERRRLAQESLAKLDGVLAVVKSAVDHSNSFLEFIGQEPHIFAFKESWDLIWSEALNGSVESLKAIPAHELGSYDLVVQFMMIRGAVSKVAMSVKTPNVPFAEQELVFMYHKTLNYREILNYSWAQFEYAYNDRRLEFLTGGSKSRWWYS